MAAVIFGLFAVVLHISGTFSVQYLDKHDLERSWLKHAPPQRWDYRKFKNFSFYPERKYSNFERNLDYQLFPSNWVESNKDSEKFKSLTKLSNALSSDSDITSARSQLAMLKYLRTSRKENQKEIVPKMFFKSIPVIMNTSSIREPATHRDMSNNELSTILYQIDSQHATDKISTQKEVNIGDGGTDIKNETNEHTDMENLKSNSATVQEEKENKIDAEDKIGKLDKNEIKETMPVQDPNKNTDVGDEKSSQVLVEEETKGTTPGQDENKNTDVDETTNEVLVEKETRGTTPGQDKNKNTDVGDKKSSQTLVEEETKGTTPGQDENNNTDVDETTNEVLVEKETKGTTPVQDKNKNTDVGDEKSSQTLVEEETTPVQDEKKEHTEVDENTIKTSTMVINKNTTDNPSATEETPTTISKITSPETATETVEGLSISISTETAQSVDNSTTVTKYMSNSDSSSSEAIPSTTKLLIPTSEVTDVTVVTKSSKNDEDITVSIAPEHDISIPSIKKAKTVISVVFLVIGLIAVAVLAVYIFREKRKAVKYDQLKLLP